MKTLFTSFLLLLFFVIVSCSKETDYINDDYNYAVVNSYIAHADSKYPRNTEASCVMLRDGSLLCVYTQFYDGTADDDSARIVAVKSNDGGRTWSLPSVIVDNFCDSNVMSASIIRYNNELHLFFLANNSDKEGNFDCNIGRVISTDDGISWTTPEVINQLRGYLPVLNDAVIVDDSRILIPVYYFKPEESFMDKAKCFVLYSDDGFNWQKSNDIIVEENVHGGLEPTLCRLGDNRILMSMRTELGYQYFSISENRGQSFAPAYRSTLTSSNSPCKIINYQGLLFAIHNPCIPTRRNRLVISRSDDNGTTWNEVYVIEEEEYIDASIAYPSAFVEDDRIFITHWHLHYGVGYSLKFHSLNMKSLTAK